MIEYTCESSPYGLPEIEFPIRLEPHTLGISSALQFLVWTKREIGTV
jgi:hypothetical protein